MSASILNEQLLTQKTLKEKSQGLKANASHETDIKNICWRAFWTNIGLAVFKILVGFLEKTTGAMGFSQLLLIDGMTSAAIAMTTSNILFGQYMSHPETFDSQYPYGKGKAQYIGSLFVGTILSISAAIILGLAFKTFFVPMNLEPVGMGLSIALISIAASFLLILYIRGKQVHEHLEAKRMIKLQTVSIVSSLIVCNSLIFTGLLGWFFMERIGSLSISLLVVVLSFRIIKQSLDGIMDRSGGEQLEASIKELILAVDGVEKIYCVRSRHAGHNTCVDIQIAVNKEYSIRQTDLIEAEICKQISKKLSNINHVTTVKTYPA
ncbi:MAG: mamB [Candidatus Magnetoglobus multicellularis str. Araruama]|uniref:MamB n=2 Tax=Candidatus Magnetoglobus multicellularis TaxID=418099 RepID=F4ZYV0_9BACT|nr:MamB [Candidatus Magnetoglobus multicellularis]ETR64746.1 MAG: mamB [Candidatus Magnetoglobus multicellularis str. Araruama]